MSHKKNAEERFGELVAEIGVAAAEKQIRILKGFLNGARSLGDTAKTPPPAQEKKKTTTHAEAKGVQ